MHLFSSLKYKLVPGASWIFESDGPSIQGGGILDFLVSGPKTQGEIVLYCNKLRGYSPDITREQLGILMDLGLVDIEEVE